MILSTHGTELTALLLELYNQIGVGPQEVEFADATSVFDGFGWADLTPGSHIRIYWLNVSSRPEDIAEIYEDGYVFTLPSMEGNDVSMAGVVHIPYPPNWGGKGEIEPQWISLNKLVALPGIIRIELLRKV